MRRRQWTAGVSLVAALGAVGPVATAQSDFPSPSAPRESRPAVPAPAPLASFKGFSPRELDPYSHLLSRSEREGLTRVSTALFRHPGFEVARELLAARARWRKMSARAGDPPEAGPDSLFTYELPDDPVLMIGTGRGFGGSVPPPPRLVADAFAPPPTADSAAGAAPGAGSGAGAGAGFDDDWSWIYDHPARLCLGMADGYIDATGGPLPGIFDHMAPLAGLNRRHWSLLQGILGQVDPLDGGPDDPPAPPPEDNASSVPPDPEDERSEADDSLKRLKPLPGLLPTLEKDCARAKGRFVRGARDGKGRLEVVACALADGRRVGFAAVVEDGSASRVSIVLEYREAATGLGVALRVSRDGSELHSLIGGGKHGPWLLWGEDGQAAALDFRYDPAQEPAATQEYDVWEWHAGGALKLEGRRRGGKARGRERTWYADGALAGIVDFDDQGGVLRYREWYANGHPAEDSGFDGGRLHGTRRWWHQNGRPAGQAAYDQGEVTGPLTLWYPDGKPGFRGAYAKGALKGPAQWLYEDGTTLYEGTFHAGSPDGPHRLSGPAGNPLVETEYARGVPHGRTVRYGKGGVVIVDQAFQNGQRQGVATLAWPEGAPYVTAGFRDGRLHGETSVRLRQGEVVAACTFEEGALARFTTWHQDGTIQSEGRLVDKESGILSWIKYSRTGQPSRECTSRADAEDGCRFFAADGREVPVPDAAALRAALERRRTATPSHPAGPIWSPAACGGATRQVNISTAGESDREVVIIRESVKGTCADQTLAESLTCTVPRLPDGTFGPPDCEAANSRTIEADLQSVIDEMKSGGGPANGL